MRGKSHSTALSVGIVCMSEVLMRHCVKNTKSYYNRLTRGIAENSFSHPGQPQLQWVLCDEKVEIEVIRGRKGVLRKVWVCLPCWDADSLLPGSGYAEPRMTRRRRGDAVYHVGDTDTVFQTIGGTRGSFHIALLLFFTPSLSCFLVRIPCPLYLPSTPWNFKRSAFRDGPASLILPPSLPPSLCLISSSLPHPRFLSITFWSPASLVSSPPKTTQLLPVCSLQYKIK